MPCFLGEPFQHDLFVSYSHGAFPGEQDSDLKCWSQKFAKELRGELARMPEFEKISLYLDQSQRVDESVDPTAGLPEHLEQHASGSALLAILMTPHYLRSDWCRREREWWHGRNRPDTFGAGERIFICRVWPTDKNTWPQELPDAVGYYCYDQNKDLDKVRPFTWRGSKRDLDDYNDLLVELSGDIVKRLRTIRAALEQRRKRDAAAARLAADGGQVIYLHARKTHAQAWERVGGALENGGFVVLPGERDPVERDPKRIREIADRRIDILSGCDGLLLLGTDDGRALDADLVVVGRQDRHSARARTERLLPCGVLDTVGPPIATRQRKSAAHALGIEWIDTTRDIWPTDVKSWLNEASGVMERA
jgi:hypothetical protein